MPVLPGIRKTKLQIYVFSIIHTVQKGKKNRVVLNSNIFGHTVLCSNLQLGLCVNTYSAPAPLSHTTPVQRPRESPISARSVNTVRQPLHTGRLRANTSPKLPQHPGFRHSINPQPWCPVALSHTIYAVSIINVSVTRGSRLPWGTANWTTTPAHRHHVHLPLIMREK